MPRLLEVSSCAKVVDGRLYIKKVPVECTVVTKGTISLEHYMWVKIKKLGKIKFNSGDFQLLIENLIKNKVIYKGAHRLINLGNQVPYRFEIRFNENRFFLAQFIEFDLKERFIVLAKYEVLKDEELY